MPGARQHARFETDAIEHRVFEDRAAEVGAAELRAMEVRASEICPREDRPLQAGAREITPREVGGFEERAREIDPDKLHPREIDAREVAVRQALAGLDRHEEERPDPLRVLGILRGGGGGLVVRELTVHFHHAALLLLQLGAIGRIGGARLQRDLRDTILGPPLRELRHLREVTQRRESWRTRAVARRLRHHLVVVLAPRRVRRSSLLLDLGRLLCQLLRELVRAQELSLAVGRESVEIRQPWRPLFLGRERSHAMLVRIEPLGLEPPAQLAVGADLTTAKILRQKALAPGPRANVALVEVRDHPRAPRRHEITV